MSSKRTERLCILNKNVNSQKYISILEDFPIPCLEDQSGNSDVIILTGIALCHRSGEVIIFLSESIVPQTQWPMYIKDISLTLKNMVFKL